MQSTLTSLTDGEDYDQEISTQGSTDSTADSMFMFYIILLCVIVVLLIAGAAYFYLIWKIKKKGENDNQFLEQKQINLAG